MLTEDCRELFGSSHLSVQFWLFIVILEMIQLISGVIAEQFGTDGKRETQR